MFCITLKTIFFWKAYQSSKPVEVDGEKQAPNRSRAVSYAGLDFYAGYLHADRPGKPSLVLDLMEKFRQQVVD